MSIDDFTARLAETPISWQLARLLSWALAINAVVTAWDYMHTPGRTPQSLTMVERLASLHTWGILFLIGGGFLVLGLTLRRHLAVWFGHFLCAVLYIGFTAATAQAVWQFSHSPSADSAPSIWRAVTMSLAVTLAHGALCIARGPVPRRES